MVRAFAVAPIDMKKASGLKARDFGLYPRLGLDEQLYRPQEREIHGVRLSTRPVGIQRERFYLLQTRCVSNVLEEREVTGHILQERRIAREKERSAVQRQRMDTLVTDASCLESEYIREAISVTAGDKNDPSLVRIEPPALHVLQNPYVRMT